jgi:hypothetical protein
MYDVSVVTTSVHRKSKKAEVLPCYRQWLTSKPLYEIPQDEYDVHEILQSNPTSTRKLDNSGCQSIIMKVLSVTESQAYQ